MVDFVRCILDSVRSGSRVVAEAVSRLPDSIISMSENIIRGEEIWRRLPEGVVVSEIFRRLTIRDVARARCVCKSWNSLLTSPQFRQCLFSYGGFCTDIDRWMSSSGCDLPELRWTAVTHHVCVKRPHLDVDVVDDSGEKISSLPFWMLMDLASSHGLMCRIWLGRGRILVGNHRTRKWKLLPPLPGVLNKKSTPVADESHCVRFVRHDRVKQTYALFFLEICPVRHQAFACLYDSCSSSWQLVSRQPMPCDRFRRGIYDASVVVVGYRYLRIHRESSVQESRVEDVGIMAYDFSNNSWDEITVKLLHGSDSHCTSSSAELGNSSNRLLERKSGHSVHSVFLCANAKDEYCRLLVVNGREGVMCLWQLDESCTFFRLMSTVELRPQWPWEDVLDDVVRPPWPWGDHITDMDRARYMDTVALDGMWTATWIIRSDATVFMAMVTYGTWSWLVIYDVGRLSWLTAHAYGDMSNLHCGRSCHCRWLLLEYDVQWHDHEQLKQHDVNFQWQQQYGYSPYPPPLMALQGRLQPPSRPHAAAIRAATAALGPQRSRHCLHLVRAPDIWSSP